MKICKECISYKSEKSTDWLTKGVSPKELEAEKAEAIAEAERELKEKIKCVN